MKKYEFDRIDFKLLDLLQKDARLSNKQLASAVNLAQSSCHERLKRLWTSGVIKTAKAHLDSEKIGFTISAFFMIGISKHEQQTIDLLLDEMHMIPEVQASFLITGRYDLMVQVIALDMTHLRDLAYQHFTHRAVITRFETSIIYQGRENFSVPLDT